ncbi:MAG: hypothetical protein Q9166_004208 [cf. Caloplaca sp. 2 TL-2023]
MLGLMSLQIAQSDQMGPLEVDITGFNPIIELAKETGTPLHRWKESTLLVDSEGHPVPSIEANKALKQVWEILEEASEYSKARGDELHPSASLYSFFEGWCDRAVQRSDMTKREMDLVLGMSQMWGAYAQMQLKAMMVSVESQTDGPRPVSVTTADGKKQYFDDVVVTTPLGWLKQHKESIGPLYPRIASAIDAISFGRLEKVLIEFPNAFWENDITNTEKCSDDTVSFVHWLTPAYATQTNPHKWRLECVSFHAFDTPYRRNILLFYTFGDCSTHITTCIHGLQGKARDQWLQEFFEPYYAALPGYSPYYAPVRFLATEWCNDDLAGNGCYSNFQVGMTDAARDVEAIRHGMPEQHIYFAGEHTAPFDGLGTVAGAYTSGEMIAKRIIESWQPTEAIIP